MIDPSIWISPASVLIVAGLLVPFLRGRGQDVLFLGAPIVALALVWAMAPGAGTSFSWLGLSLTPLAADGIARLFGTAFAVAALAGALFGLGQKNVTERAAALVYAGAAQGVVFAGDLVTLFVFWEVMAIGSTLVIWSNGAEKAGFRYALMHIFGGVLLFAGIVASAGAAGDITIRPMRADSVGHWLLLAGLLVNAGAPPVSAWVSDAYPKASWSGAVFLSAFTTKAAVAMLIRLFPGEPILVVIGLIMAVYGLLYALLENDLRRLLSYSIVGQVGFMVVAVGIGTPLALAAAALHAFAHILYKALLMMTAGTLLRATGTSRLTGLGGLARALPLTLAAMVVGGLSLSAMPLTAGFVSKSAIQLAVGESGSAVAWFALTAISAGSFLYAGLKLPWFAMLRPAKHGEVVAPDLPMKLAMAGLSIAILVFGCFPTLILSLAPAAANVPVLTGDHILFQLQLLVASAICFFLFLKLLQPDARITIDCDWLWRILPYYFIETARRPLSALAGLTRFVPEETVARMAKIRGLWPLWALQAGNWRTGDIALAATALLGIGLLIAAL